MLLYRLCELYAALGITTAVWLVYLALAAEHGLLELAGFLAPFVIILDRVLPHFDGRYTGEVSS